MVSSNSAHQQGDWAGPNKFMTISVYDDFEQLRGSAGARLSVAETGNLFHSLDWFELLFRTVFAEGWRPRVYECAGAGGGRTYLFCTHRAGGRELRGLSNFYSMEFGPVSVGGADAAAGVCDILRFIAAERPAWRSIQFLFLRREDPATTAMAETLEANGFATNLYFQFENWRCPLGKTSFSEYFETRPSRLRNTIRRRSKQLAKLADYEIEIAREPKDAARLLGEYEAVYAGSWKDEEQYPHFMPGLVELCARQGLLRFGVLRVDGAPAAAQVWLTYGGKTLIYKLAYDEKFRKYSVGSILTCELARLAIDEDGVREIDYGVGSEPYKRDWMTDCREIGGLEAYNTRALGSLLKALDLRTRTAVKRLIGKA